MPVIIRLLRQLFLIGALLLGFVGASAKAPAVSETASVDGRVYVDLGLPSGTKWATCNVGATKPTESGYYWSSSLDGYYPYDASCLYFGDGLIDWDGSYRFRGQGVRAVAE